MTAHAEASSDSKQLCQSLFDRLASRIPNLERRETKRWCALFQQGRNRFAYVGHRKTSGEIEVWCAGDIERLVNHGGMHVVPRAKMRIDWERRFPGRFFLKSSREVNGACALLYEVSFNAS